MNVRTIIEYRFDIEELSKKVRRNNIIHYSTIMLIPAIIYSLIVIGAFTNDTSTMADDDLQPLFIFMTCSRIALLTLFEASGLYLLRSLKSYNLKIYRFSKCKVRASTSDTLKIDFPDPNLRLHRHAP